MYVYIVESGFCSQRGDILHVSLTYKGAEDFLKPIIEEHKRVGDVLTGGLSEYDKDPRAICGCWAGPAKGNRSAHGYRIIKAPVMP